MGSALSTFGEDFGWDGNPIDSNISYKLLGSSIDELISKFNLPKTTLNSMLMG